MANKRVSELTSTGSAPTGAQLLLSRLSTAVTKTATTISFAAADQSINDSGNGLVAAGFVAGDQVKVTGAANGGNNVFSATGTVVSAGKIVTNAGTIVDEAAGASVTITKWESVRIDKDALVAALAASAPQWICVACGDEVTAHTTGAAKVTFHWPFTGTVSEVWGGLTTPQASGSIFTVDLNDGGASMLSTKLTIDNAEETSLTAGAQPVLSDTAVTKGGKATIDFDQVGDGTAKGFKLWLRLVPTP